MSAETVALAKGVTRREFLNYVWGATMAVFMAEMGGAIFLYACPASKRRVRRHIYAPRFFAARSGQRAARQPGRSLLDCE